MRDKNRPLGTALWRLGKRNRITANPPKVGHTHTLYACQLRRWFTWYATNVPDPLAGIQRAHVESASVTSTKAGCGTPRSTRCFMASAGLQVRHIDGLIAGDPAVYARLPKIHADETRTLGLDGLELIRFLQVAQTH